MRNNHWKQKEAAGMAGLSDQKGYSLLEVVVVMGIFTIIVIIATSAFDRLLSTGRQESQTASSQIEGVVGLEMLRRDLSHAGYGLPWSFLNTPGTAFEEVTTAPADDTGIDPADFNEVVPHPLACATAGTDSTNPGTDYLVIKSALLPLKGTNSTAGRWGYLNYSTSGGAGASYVKRSGNAESDLREGDRVVMIVSSISGTGAQSRQLLNSAAGTDAASFSWALGDPDLPVPAAYQPSDPSRSYLVYGITGVAPKMPYNRADYYVNRPPADDPDFKIPPHCNPGTGILFKAVANHAGGYATPYPLLNCVGDMKVVYTLDQLGEGNLSYFPATSNVIAALTPQELRTQLRSVTVYILTHEGRKDRSYIYPSDSLFVGPTIGSTRLTSVGKLWSGTELTEQFGADWKNYRWKVYGVAVTPMNMQE